MKIIKLIIFMTAITSITAYSQDDYKIGIIHEIDYSNKGSKSEARHGRLFVAAKKGKKEIPDVFSYLYVNDKAYTFLQRSFVFGDDGYFPSDPVSIKVSDNYIRNDQLSAGYYKSPVKLKGTPDNWMYGVCSEGSYFFSISGIFSMIDSEKPKPIQRMILTEIK